MGYGTSGAAGATTGPLLRVARSALVDDDARDLAHRRGGDPSPPSASIGTPAAPPARTATAAPTWRARPACGSRAARRGPRPRARAPQLRVPADRKLDGRDQVGLGERLDEVRHRAGRAGPFHEVALAERGQHDHRCEPGLRDLLGRADPVEQRHLHVEEDQVRAPARPRAGPRPRRRPPPRRRRSPPRGASRQGRAGSVPRPRPPAPASAPPRRWRHRTRVGSVTRRSLPTAPPRGRRHCLTGPPGGPVSVKASRPRLTAASQHAPGGSADRLPTKSPEPRRAVQRRSVRGQGLEQLPPPLYERPRGDAHGGPGAAHRRIVVRVARTTSQPTMTVDCRHRRTAVDCCPVTSCQPGSATWTRRAADGRGSDAYPRGIRTHDLFRAIGFEPMLYANSSTRALHRTGYRSARDRRT